MTSIQITGDGSEQRAEMQKATGGGSEAAYVTGGRHGADSVADSAEAGCLPGERRGDQPPICFSLISARVLQSMHRWPWGGLPDGGYRFPRRRSRSEEHKSELQSRPQLVCRPLP